MVLPTTEGETVSQDLATLSLNPRNSYLDEEEQPPPPPPSISSAGIIATDITRKFKSAARALEPGELVKDGHFTLFESVSALEIMDPKMDSGCLAPGESLDEDYDVTRPLLPKEVLGIIDQLLCLEMAWHLGYPLSQTLLTNVYLEAMLEPKPKTIHDAHFIRNRSGGGAVDPLLGILRAYCLGLLKTCWYVNERIKSEHYYEEEDFVTNTYHRSLLGDIDREEVLDELRAARKVAHELRHDMSSEISLALDCRLEIRTAFLRAIELSSLRSNPESLKLPWKQMQGAWDNICKSHGLATAVPEAFSTKIQRRLTSTMPPRPIVQLGFEEADGHFRRLFADGIEVLNVLNFVDPQSLLNFVLSFQARKPQPLVYIRTLLQSFLFKDMTILGHLSLRQLMDGDLAIVALPCSRLLDRANDEVEAPHDPRFALAHQMETFRQRAAQSYLDIFRAFCQNRCRIRRTLCHSIQDWETVQVDAEQIDGLLQVQLDERPLVPGSEGGGGGGAPAAAYLYPLSSWAYLYKLRLMEWIVQLGFELETYQPEELGGMYWYLGYLAKTRAQHVERIKTFTMSTRYERNSRLTEPMKAEFTRSLTYLRTTILDAAVTWELAEALCCLYTVLRRLGLMAAGPTRPYGDDALRYDLRMRPFAPIGLPELPSFAEFNDAVARPDRETADLLAYADRSLVGARKGFDILAKMSEKEAFSAHVHDRWVAATKNCLKSVIAASLAVSMLQKHEHEPDRLRVEIPPPNQGYHEWWVVPKITETS